MSNRAVNERNYGEKAEAAMPGPPDDHRVYGNIELLRRQLGRLETVAGMLEKQLEPILAPDASQVRGDRDTMPEMPPLAVELFALSDGYSRTIDRLVRISDRVGL